MLFVITALFLINLVLSQDPSASADNKIDAFLLNRLPVAKRSYVGSSFDDKYCRWPSDCSPKEYCGKQGKCISKRRDGEACIRGLMCLSNHCHASKCKSLPTMNKIVKNGKCENDEQCHNEQYCSNKKCRDRKLTGTCSSDSECMSNNCRYHLCKMKPSIYFN